MAKLVTHKFVSAIPDGDDATIVRPSNWNDTHDVSGVAESGTNTDITSMTGITGGISSPNFVQFDTTAAESSAVGKLFWDDGDGVLSNGLKGGNVTLQIGTQEFARVFNDSGTTLTKGQAVYISGAQGNRVAVKLARADVEATSFGTIGLVAETMTNGAEGFIIVSGALYKLNTLGLVAGATVYLSPITAGALTTTKPQAPQQLVVVGWVERVNATVGSIYVKVDNGYELDELHDVKIVSPTTGQTLVYDQPTGVWNNSNAPTISGGTINGTTIGATTPSSIVGTTITGQTGVLRGTGQNLLTYSNTFTNAAWLATGSTVATTVATTDPFGGSNAYIVTATVTGTAGLITPSVTTTTTSYTFSLYAKAGTSPFLRVFTTSNVWFNLSNGTLGTVGGGITASITSAGNGWYRCVATFTGTSGAFAPLLRLADADNATPATNGTTQYIYGSQLEIGTTANAFVATTTTAVYGTPTLSFSGVSEIGLQSNGALYLQPAGTGAIQAQATTSTTAGGNVRGANAVDWQTSRSVAGQVASGFVSAISGGERNTASGAYGGVVNGYLNTSNASFSNVVGGNQNQSTQQYANVVGGFTNTAGGWFNFIGGGFTNSGTAAAAVTTQATTTVTSGSTAVTLSGSNASIRVGQLITGTGINAPDTYVAAISGTALTLSRTATATGTPTLSFFTPHGVVVGGGNNQATGSYSFIGGGGDAGTAANRNVASGDWSFVGGGTKNVASGAGSVIAGGGFEFSTNFGNTASGTSSVISGGIVNVASGVGSVILGGWQNTANGTLSTVVGGRYGTTRGITGNLVFPASNVPISGGGLGFSQAALLIVATQTTNATATALTSDGAAAANNNQVILPNNSAYLFKATVISGVTGGGNTSGWKLEGVIKRGANAASTTIVGSVTTTLLAQDAGASGWVIAATADTTNGGLRITFTGQASTTIRTVCKVETTEVTF